jgi:hypothetical protein
LHFMLIFLAICFAHSSIWDKGKQLAKSKVEKAKEKAVKGLSKIDKHIIAPGKAIETK